MSYSRKSLTKIVFYTYKNIDIKKNISLYIVNHVQKGIQSLK